LRWEARGSLSAVKSERAKAVGCPGASLTVKGVTTAMAVGTPVRW
jgi:hypothetical protein